MTGIDRGTHYDWLKADPGYKAAFEAVQDQAAQSLEDEAVRRAYEGVERPVTVAGKRELVREYSDTLLIFRLKGLRPAKYRERYDVAVNAGEGLVQAMARGRARVLAAQAGRTIDARPDDDSRA
jgi:hypothetical protein